MRISLQEHQQRVALMRAVVNKFVPVVSWMSRAQHAIGNRQQSVRKRAEKRSHSVSFVIGDYSP